MPGMRALAEFAHPALAMIGIGFWLGYVVSRDRLFAVIGLGVLLGAICAGVSLFTANTRAAKRLAANPGAAPTTPGTAPLTASPVVLTLHGIGATLTALVGTNIGAACVFVNYDGVEKHKSVIGDHARVGSDNMIVAPVTIGDGAYTAAGSVIISDVPPGAMAVARARQRNIEGWVERKRAGTPAAEAARRALAARAQDEPDASEGN